MNLGWQNVVVLGLVAFAIAYVARQAWLAIANRKSGCGSGCSKCPVQDNENGATDSKTFISANEVMTTFDHRTSKP
jgi:hypothetical protein